MFYVRVWQAAITRANARTPPGTLSVLRHALSQAKRSQRFAGQISARLQTLVALITDDRMTRFRSEDAVDLSTVIALSGQSVLSVGNLYSGGSIVRTVAVPAIPGRIVAALVVIGRIVA